MKNSDLPVDYVSDLEPHNQVVWLATMGGGLVKLNSGVLTVYNSLNSGLPNNYINCLSVENNGIVYMGPSNSDLVWYNGAWGSLPAGPYNHNVTAVTIDKQNYMWVTNIEYLTVYNLNNPNEIGYFQLPELNTINTISIDSANNEWLGSRDKGIFMLQDSTDWFVYNKDNSGLPGNDVRAILTDNEIEWIGTLDGGLVKFDGTDWEAINTNTSAPFLSSVNSLFTDDNGNEWIGFWGDGIWKYDNNIWTNFNSGNSALSDNYVMSVIQDNSGNYWIGTYGGGLNKYDGSEWTNYNTSNSGLSDSDIISVKNDSQGNLWIATWGGGLNKFDGTNWTIYNSSNSDLTDDYIFSMFVDNSDNIWIGTFGSGLFKFNEVNWQVFNKGNSAIPSDFISAIEQDRDNNIWLGTWADGIAKFNNNSFTTFNSNNTSFPIDNINCIIADDSNYIDAGTRNSGLIRFAANDTLGESWKLYNKYNSGMIDNEVKALEKDSEGKIWIGFEEGIAVFNSAGVLSVKNQETSSLSNFHLFQNYPNPFNPTTTINYQLPQTGYVTLKVYDMLGREVTTLVNEEKYKGSYSVNFDASKLASGVYIYRIKIKDYMSSKKMLFLK